MEISDNQINHLEQIALNLRRNIIKMIQSGQGGHLEGDFFVSRKHENLAIIDRTGGGDSFASALIYNILKKKILKRQSNSLPRILLYAMDF